MMPDHHTVALWAIFKCHCDRERKTEGKGCGPLENSRADTLMDSEGLLASVKLRAGSLSADKEEQRRGVKGCEERG